MTRPPTKESVARPSSGQATKCSAADYLPTGPKPTLPQLQAAAASCRGCDLYKNAAQTVFGEGSAKAEIVLVGEKPGDREDFEGHPFVGPAGALLDRALQEAGIDRKRVYVTNAVKHFKWTPAPRGKRRLHSKPSAREMQACRPWLHAELNAIHPQVVVLLGATAAQSLLGANFRITKSRGKLIADTPWAPNVMATWHPSAILRAPDDDARRKHYEALVSDLRAASEALRSDLCNPTRSETHVQEA